MNVSFSSNFSLYPFSTIKYLVLILFFFCRMEEKKEPSSNTFFALVEQARPSSPCLLLLLFAHPLHPVAILNSPKLVRSYFKLLLAYSIFSFSISHLLLIVICKIIKEKIKGNFLSLSTSEFRQYNTEKTEIDASYIRKLVS